jgi:hypothetical protein
MSMNVASPARHIVVNLRDTVYDLHYGSSGDVNLLERQPGHE